MKLLRQKRLQAQAGFTLLEVLIAAAIFAIGIVAIMRLFPEAIRQLQTASQRTISAQLAESELGRVRVATAENLFREQSVLTGAVVQAIYGVGAIYQGYTKTSVPLRGSYSVDANGNPSGTYLQRVTFTVLMPDGREEVYVTYVAKQ